MSDAMDLIPLECSVYYSFLRLHCEIPVAPGKILSVLLLRDGHEDSPERQSFALVRSPGSSQVQFTLEALIDREAFPAHYAVQIATRETRHIVPCSEIVEKERKLYAQSLMGKFEALIEAWLAANPGQRPTLLDVGGRARSGYRYSDLFQRCEVTVTDIISDTGVDVVADIHKMSQSLGTGRFNFAICVSVFEHLLMPWKAALEINKVLKPGGIIMVHTHQTVGMHDIPWDYYRFSDESWKGLFNASTGFAIETTLMCSFQRIVPMHYYGVYPGFENAGGFLESSVIASKVGSSALGWDVELSDVISGNYPG